MKHIKLFEQYINEAISKLFAALEKSGKLTPPNGGASMNGKYYQLEGGSQYDVIQQTFWCCASCRSPYASTNS
jgi:hypothetical protein